MLKALESYQNNKGLAQGTRILERRATPRGESQTFGATFTLKLIMGSKATAERLSRKWLLNGWEVEHSSWHFHGALGENWGLASAK